jgi:hypothetical protein
MTPLSLNARLGTTCLEKHRPNHYTENKPGNSESSTMRLKHNTAEEGENNEAYLAFSGRSAS